MWHRIWDTAASFHQRYIRPVWIRVHYNKLQEIVDDDGELEDDLLYIKNGGSGDRTHISRIGTTNHNNNSTSAQVVVHYGSINKLKNNNNNTSYLDSLKHEEFDEVDAGFYRPFPVLETLPPNEDISDSINPIVSETKGPSSSCLKNSTVTDLKHAIQFPSSKKPPYRLVQEEADRIEIISMDNSSVSRTKSLNNQDSSSDHKEEFQYTNKRLQQPQHYHSDSPKKQNKHLNSNQVEDILQTTPSLSNNVVTKKSKSRRKKAFKQMKKIAGWTWKSLKQGFYAAPYFIKPQPHASIYSMATQYKAYFG